MKNVAIGTTIGGLSTTDLDSGDTHTYTLVSGTGDTDNASFSISGANLLTNTALDYETKNSYSILGYKLRIAQLPPIPKPSLFLVT